MLSKMKQTHAQEGWKPLETKPDNCIVSAWRKEAGLLCADVTTSKDGVITGSIKGTGDARVSGEIELKDFDSLEAAFEQMGKLLTAVSTVRIPAKLRVASPISDAEVSVG